MVRISSAVLVHTKGSQRSGQTRLHAVGRIRWWCSVCWVDGGSAGLVACFAQGDQPVRAVRVKLASLVYLDSVSTGPIR